MNGRPPRPTPDVRVAAFGEEIRSLARELRARFPGCDVEYLVHSLEYETGLRPAVIRRALAGSSGRNRDPIA